ncbi:MAG: dienelactone hydrolase family protein [Xanthomonadales bacterium]|nr:dienelactone hydrolase family protein [Xanthomonadales bacterium]
MSRRLRLETAHGWIGAYRSDPAIPPKGALVVVQEIFGLNRHIRAVVDRFAEHGYIAMAPAMFDLVDEDVELDYDEAGVQQGRELAGGVGFDRAVDCVRAAAKQLESDAKVGVVGFCWGGTVAFLSNARLSLPAISYYGGRSVPFLGEKIEAPMLFHFGEHDPIIPPEDVEEHRRRQSGAEFFVWDAGHGFNCDQRDDYRPDVAALAMERTLGFFGRTLK